MRATVLLIDRPERGRTEIQVWFNRLELTDWGIRWVKRETDKKRYEEFFRDVGKDLSLPVQTP